MCRATVDHNLMRKTLIKELQTFIKISGFTTVTSIYFGGGKSLYCTVRTIIYGNNTYIKWGLVEGTPSLAEPATIHAVVNEVAKLCHLPAHAEIDLEANPSSARQSVLR